MCQEFVVLPTFLMVATQKKISSANRLQSYKMQHYFVHEGVKYEEITKAQTDAGAILFSRMLLYQVLDHVTCHLSLDWLILINFLAGHL